MKPLVLSLILLCVANGQRLEFEVATVKQAVIPDKGAIVIGPRTGPGTRDPSRVSFSFTTLKGLLMSAYDVKVYQISGPGWMDTDPYDVVATVPPGTTKEQANVMLRNLLADRFQLTLHHETKELPLYELVVTKGGSKLQPSEPAPAEPAAPPAPGPPQLGKDGMPIISGRTGMMAMMMPGRMRMTAKAQTLPAIATMLSSRLARPVVDKTGLTGEFDYSLEFSTEGLAGAGPVPGIAPLPRIPPPGSGAAPPPGAPSIDPDAPSLVTAVQEQLGLRLDQKKGPVDVLIIDRAEKVPTQN